MCYLFIFYVTSVSETGSEGTNGKLPQPSFHFLLLGSWSDYLLMLSKYQSHMIWLLDPLLSRGTCLRRREGWARKCCVSLETHLNHGIPVSFRKCGWRWIHSVRLQLSQPHQEICGLRERYFFSFWFQHCQSHQLKLEVEKRGETWFVGLLLLYVDFQKALKILWMCTKTFLSATIQWPIISTVDPWATGVWTAQVHLYMEVF